MRDDTPIRRLTRKPATNYTPWIVGGGLVLACVVAFLIGVIVRANRGGNGVVAGGRVFADNPLDDFREAAEGAELKKDRFWSNEATTVRIQKLVDFIVANPSETVYFDTDANFSAVRDYQPDTVQRRYFGGDYRKMYDAGFSGELNQIAYFAKKEPDKFTNPSMFQIGEVSHVVVSPPANSRVRPNDAVAMIRKSMASKPLSFGDPFRGIR